MQYTLIILFQKAFSPVNTLKTRRPNHIIRCHLIYVIKQLGSTNHILIFPLFKPFSSTLYSHSIFCYSYYTPIYPMRINLSEAVTPIILPFILCVLTYQRTKLRSVSYIPVQNVALLNHHLKVQSFPACYLTYPFHLINGFLAHGCINPLSFAM